MIVLPRSMFEGWGADRPEMDCFTVCTRTFDQELEEYMFSFIFSRVCGVR